MGLDTRVRNWSVRTTDLGPVRDVRRIDVRRHGLDDWGREDSVGERFTGDGESGGGGETNKL